jgi:hypothetical protein
VHFATVSLFYHFDTRFLNNNTMPGPANEAKILMAIKALESDKKLSVRKAAQIYDVPGTTLRDRMGGVKPITERRPKNQLLDELEEQVLIQHIVDLDERGFSPRLKDIEDIAKSILASRHGPPIGKLWAHRLVKRTPELKTRFSRSYDYQRAQCEDPKLLEAWFQRVTDVKAKYGIQDCDIWNFDETGFQMGVISSCMVVTQADRRGKRKRIQPGNREWATAIACVNAEGHSIPPYLLVKGTVHLTHWYTEGSLPGNWRIKPTENGWTDNATGLDWIQHFNKHTQSLKKGGYQMLILDGHESHMSIEFDKYCKTHNIVAVCLPPHSSHLTQPLDVACFGVLKRNYSLELDVLIKAHITHITKTEFFMAFRAAYNKTMTPKNIKAGFRGAGLVPFDPQAVISRLDVRLRTPTPTGLPPAEADSWVSKTPHNPTEALSQAKFIKNKIACHQGSSPTPILNASIQGAKGLEVVAHKLAIATARIDTLEEALEALSRRKRAKRTHVAKGGSLDVEDGIGISTQREVDEQMQAERRRRGGDSGAGLPTTYRCSKCGKTGHNARTCQINVEIPNVHNSQ